jgi:ABC-type bacteriocin/lantibiotic exporter with double-glycine peptidase domain/CRP-like cAMP-binding protein
MNVSDRATPPEAQRVLDELPMLELMPEDVRRLVVDSFVPVSFEFGSVIVREGEEADAFYVIVSGAARAIKTKEDGEEVTLNVMRAGDAFGEVGLIEDTTRTATVRASGPVQVLRLDKSVFKALVQLNPEVSRFFERRIRSHRLRDFLRLFTEFARLPADTLEMLIAALEPAAAAKDEVVIEQGGAPAPMYIVQQGRLRVYHEQDGERSDLAYLRRGDFFGERSLLRATDQVTSVEAVADCELLVLSREAFGRLIDRCAVFRAVIEERIERYDYKRKARVPLDFAEEIVPRDATVVQVFEEQVDEVLEAPGAEPEEEEAAEEFGGETDTARRPPIKRFPHFWQVDEMDCGAACLAMVTRHFGRAVSLAHIRKLVHTSTDGTSLAGIAGGAADLGLEVRSMRASKGRLDEMPLPAIVHFEGNHWVVLYGVEAGRVRLADPALGPRKLPRDEFLDKWSGYAALVAYGPGLEQAPEAERNLAWLFAFLRPFRRTLALAAVLALVAAGLQMALPLVTQQIVDEVLLQDDSGALAVILVATVAVIISLTVASVAQRYLMSRTAVELDGTTLDFVTSRLLALPMSYFNSRRTGDIQRRVLGLRAIREIAVQNAVRGLTALTTIAATLVLMFVFDWLLALVFLAVAPGYAWLMRFSRKRLRPMFNSLEEAFGRYHSHQIDAIKGIETVKATGAERNFRRAMLNQFNALADKLFRADFLIMVYEAALQMVSFAALALFLLVGSLRVLAGDLTIGEFVAFNTLVVLATAPIFTVLAVWDDVQRSSVLLNRLNDIIEQEPEQGFDHSRLKPVRSMEGAVRLQNLGFTYGGPVLSPILHGINLDVEPGTTVAIVGRSGSGKTTLVRCLAGLLEPTEGTICYDGVDMRDLSHHDLRRQIGHVLQENYVFDDTIARNIAFAADEPVMEQVRWAARVANAHDFIERLPLGYDTKIGESGLTLSGGQQQRVAIARALYNRPPILIFDEATSALDTESERAVQDNLDQLFEGRTSFVIAHRLSTIRDADLIVVLERGKVAEQGTHEQLMKKQGIYYYLCSQQLAM